MKQWQESSWSEISCWVSALEPNLIPMVSVSWKGFVGQFGPYFFKYKELFVRVIERYLGDGHKSHRQSIFTTFMIGFIALVFIFGLETSEKGIPAPRNGLILNVVQFKLYFDVLFGKDELFGVKLDNLLFC